MQRIHANSTGFTLLEVVVVCAIIGVLALLAYPNLVRFTEQQQTKSSATRIAGVLETARSLAISEATPYLVYINPKSVDANGDCGPVADLVRDSDRSYSVTAGDQVREIALDKGACQVTEPLGESGRAADESVPLPVEDLAARGLELAGESLGIPVGPAGANASESRNEMVVDVVVNGATFPIDAASGRPVIAFSERGIPVDPLNRTRWGSGAGAVYLTDRHATVYAAVVQPLGGIRLRVFDRVSGKWL